jgi:hypothetical protein
MIVVIRTFEANAPNGIAAEAYATPEEFAAAPVYLLELILNLLYKKWISKGLCDISSSIPFLVLG